MSSVGFPIQSDSPDLVWSIVALILGCMSLFLGAISAVPGIIFGHLACAKIRNNPYRFGGFKFAITGLILCYAMFLISLGVLFYLAANPELLHYVADYLGYSLVLAEAD